MCHTTEFGISWLRVRSHFWHHISGVQLSDIPNAVAQVRIALQEDPLLQPESISRVERGQLNAKCREGKAVLQLAFCLDAGADSEECSVSELDGTCHLP